MRFFTICSAIFIAMTALAQSRSTLSIDVIDYNAQKIYFDCIQTPVFSKEADYVAGEAATYTFAPKHQVAMLVNAQTLILVAPGDSIHATLRYTDPKNVAISFSGTPTAVSANRVYQKVQALKRAMRYREQLLSCVTLDEKPAHRIEQSKLLLNKTANFIEAAKGKLTPESAEYIMAESEGLGYLSYMEYPKMYAELRNLPIQEQQIGDYWTCMDTVTLRTDEAALSCPEYVTMLMRYVVFKKDKAAHGNFATPNKLEDIYMLMAEELRGSQRDAVLFNLITNFIRGGKEIERAEPLIEDYRTHYNLNKDYINIIDALME